MDPEYPQSLASPVATFPSSSPSAFVSVSTPNSGCRTPLADRAASSNSQACFTPVAATPDVHAQAPCHLENCSVCLSPLCQENYVSHRGENFTTSCNHTFHRRCLSKLREFEVQSRCPMCRQQLPLGLTPPSVRAQREARNMLDTTNNHQNRQLIVSRAAAAREAVARRMRREAVHQAVAPQASSPPPLVIVGSQEPPDPEIAREEVEAAVEGMVGVEGGSSEGEGSGGEGVGCCGACAHCERRGAENTCEACESAFCSVCSTKDYSQRHERSFCLDCSQNAS